MEFFKQIKSAVNIEIEKLRSENLMGSAKEAVVELDLFLNWKTDSFFFNPQMIKTICKVSDVFLTLKESSSTPSFKIISVRNAKDDGDFALCPRCDQYIFSPEHNRRNYDNLCDRCCAVLVQDFPEHDSVTQIKERLKVTNTLDWE